MLPELSCSGLIKVGLGAHRLIEDQRLNVNMHIVPHLLLVCFLRHCYLNKITTVAFVCVVIVLILMFLLLFGYVRITKQGAL